MSSKTGLRNQFIVSRDAPRHSFWGTIWNVLVVLASAAIVGTAIWQLVLR